MRYEITTRSLSNASIWEELSFVSKSMQKLGHDRCLVLFGFAWGDEYYESNVWKEEEIPFANLVEKVKHVRQSGIGNLGWDDLFLRIPDPRMEFRFCNDSDIHLSYEQPNDVIEFFYESWKSKDFCPVRREKASETHR